MISFGLEPCHPEPAVRGRKKIIIPPQEALCKKPENTGQYSGKLNYISGDRRPVTTALTLIGVCSYNTTHCIDTGCLYKVTQQRQPSHTREWAAYSSNYTNLWPSPEQKLVECGHTEVGGWDGRIIWSLHTLRPTLGLRKWRILCFIFLASLLPYMEKKEGIQNITVYVLWTRISRVCAVYSLYKIPRNRASIRRLMKQDKIWHCLECGYRRDTK